MFLITCATSALRSILSSTCDSSLTVTRVMAFRAVETIAQMKMAPTQNRRSRLYPWPAV